MLSSSRRWNDKKLEVFQLSQQASLGGTAGASLIQIPRLTRFSLSQEAIRTAQKEREQLMLVGKWVFGQTVASQAWLRSSSPWIPSKVKAIVYRLRSFKKTGHPDESLMRLQISQGCCSLRGRQSWFLVRVGEGAQLRQGRLRPG